MTSELLTPHSSAERRSVVLRPTRQPQVSDKLSDVNPVETIVSVYFWILVAQVVKPDIVEAH